MGAAALATSPSGDGFEIAFRDEFGAQRRGSLAGLWSVRFEAAEPVRRFPSHKAQGNYAGAWWFSTTGAHVGYESWLERDHVMLLDFDPDVIGLASQPFWLAWQAGDRRRRHAPDYFARRADGTGVVIDVRPDDRITPEDAEVFAVTAGACESVGWDYRRVGAIDPVLAANVRWLSGYRHPRCLSESIADRVRSLFTDGSPLDVGVAAAGDRLAVLPSLFHLMWTGGLGADMSGGPLSGNVVITATRRAA